MHNSYFLYNFGFAEGTFTRKFPNKFGILLAYSYLCTSNGKNSNKYV